MKGSARQIKPEKTHDRKMRTGTSALHKTLDRKMRTGTSTLHKMRAQTSALPIGDAQSTSAALRPLMFVGTGSDVGKSVVNAAFCRILKQDGYAPAPFKAQNMSLNSYATPDGLEMGRAQVVQAEACGIDCMVEMNPVLLKPTSNMRAQVIVNGKPVGEQSAAEYFRDHDREPLFREAMAAYERLAEKYNPIVMEGAGSISEINLHDKDITNMRVALYAQADTYLIADINKGGIFGSVYGTLELLPPEERELIKGIVINKFRGDISIFEDGIKMLEELIGIPVVSVIPYFRDIDIDDEDSVSLEKKHGGMDQQKVNVVVVLLHQMSNFTDFNALERVPEINLFYTHDREDILSADIVIIPGSKNTMSDLYHLRKSGLAQAILQAHENGTSVYGICGGFQMMGEEIHDPYHVEGSTESMPGLGIFPMKTVLSEEKVTLQRKFHFLEEDAVCDGYEIHMGESSVDHPAPLCQFEDGECDGYFKNAKAWGTYIHGIFDNPSVVKSILREVSGKTVQDFDLDVYKNEQYDKLAELVRKHSDMEFIYASLSR